MSFILFFLMDCGQWHIERAEKMGRQQVATIFSSCHRVGMMDDDHVQFKNEPACRRAWEKHNSPIDLRYASIVREQFPPCELSEIGPDGSIIEVKCRFLRESSLWKEEFAKHYRKYHYSVDQGHLHRTCKPEFRDAYAVAWGLDFPHALGFVDDPACWQQLQKVFTEDWSGTEYCRVPERKAFEYHLPHVGKVNWIELQCKPWDKVPFLDYYFTNQAATEGWGMALKKECKERALLSPQSIRLFGCSQIMSSIGIKFSSAHCIMEWEQTEAEWKEGSMTCTPELPQAMVQAMEINKELSVQNPLQARCQKVGMMSPHKIRFLQDSTCWGALLRESDNQPKDNQCEVRLKKGILVFECKGTLPVVFSSHSRLQTFEQVYIEGLKRACTGSTMTGEGRIWVKEKGLCKELLLEGMKGEWPALFSRQCELIDSKKEDDKRKDFLLVQCAKGFSPVLKNLFESLGA